MENPLNNPIFLLFISFTIGVLIDPMIKSTEWYKKMVTKNYINDRMTKNIGVLWIRKLIVNSPLKYFNLNVYIKDRPKKEDLIEMKKHMDTAEMSHLIAFYILLILCIVYVFIGKDWRLILSIFILNLLFNLYIVFLQQYNKRRINRFLKFFEKE